MAEMAAGGGARRIPVSVTEPGIDSLETFMDLLRGQPEAWDWVLREVQLNALASGASLIAIPLQAPNSLPQILGVAAAVGLKTIRERIIDAQFEQAAAAMREAVPAERVRAVHARSRAAIDAMLETPEPA